MKKGVFLLLGTNLGDRVAYLDAARARLGETAGDVIAASPIYETAAWGNTSQPDFLNQAVELETPLLPEPLLRAVLDIELSLGRERTSPWGARTIDIDILLYGDEEINTPSLQVPHPHMAARRFALAPLAQIAGHVVHPVLQQSIHELLANCPDMLPATVYKP